MANPRPRTLSHALANISDEPPSKRVKCAQRSQRKSDESGDSYDGLVVYTEDYGATSLNTTILPFLIYPLDNISSEKLAIWRDCQNEAVTLTEEYGVDADTISIVRAATDNNSSRGPSLDLGLTKDMWIGKPEKGKREFSRSCNDILWSEKVEHRFSIRNLHHRSQPGRRSESGPI